MKRLIHMITGAMAIVLSSCINDNVGPAGPVGPQGPQGEQGPKGESGFVFEYEQISFTAPDYEVILPFPGDFKSLNSDVALVYLLWEVVEIDGVDTEIWRPLPQTVFTDHGMLQYNFDFSLVDVRLFMEAEFDLAMLGAEDTDDWIVRVVIVPGDFWNSSRMTPGEIEYNDLKEMLGLPDLPTPASAHQRRR
ncbi:MAG: collagen-like protein [Cytophagales bacterium]|nr:collagen-like protein [Cytophagales bacterium]